jgi:trigger factor
MSIDGFEENIIGMKVNETKCFNATFPDDYSNADVKGKTVEFEVTVKSIYVPPIYDDEFVKKYFPEYKTKVEFETALKDRYILAAVYENVVKGTTIIKYPKAERNDALNELKNIEESFYDTYGVTLDSYIKSSFDMTREQYVENNMKSEMIYYAVAQKEGIEPTAEQLLAEVDSLIAYYKEYYMTNEGLDEATAKTKAMDFVDSLGASYSYENVLFALVDERFKEKADVTYKEKTYTSITETIAEQNKPVTE